MKTNPTIALLTLSMLFWSCSADRDVPVPAVEGDEAVFVVGTHPTRTMYADSQWDDESTQELYWGNYITDRQERIRVFCGQAGHKVGTYRINPKTVEQGVQGSSVAGEVVLDGGDGVQWGASGSPHTFYAFYPAENVGETLGDDGHTVSASVAADQSPVAYRAVTGARTGSQTISSSLQEVAANSTLSASSQTDIYCQPDMDNAVMVARTDMPADRYGQPVPLDFNVIADVLDITVNGPVTPNQLDGGNTRNYIKVYSVSVEHISGTPIVGTFTLDMAHSTATGITNGSSRIDMQLSQKAADGGSMAPVLYARVEQPQGASPDVQKDLDHLRVRAFLAPGVVKNLNELRVVVKADCGDYPQILGDCPVQHGTGQNGVQGGEAMVTGKIYPLKMGYITKSGQQYRLDTWMERLEPTAYVSQLSIPGSWHTDQAICQGTGNTSMASQFDKGIRAFEMKADCKSNNWDFGPVWEGTPEQAGDLTIKYNDLQPASTADDRNPQSSSDTRKVKVAVTFRGTFNTKLYKAVTKLKYKVINSAGSSILTELVSLAEKLGPSEFAIIELNAGTTYSIDLSMPEIGATSVDNRAGKREITKQVEVVQHANSWGSAWDQNNIEWGAVTPTIEEWIAAPETGSVTTHVSDPKRGAVNSFVGGVSYLIDELKEAIGSKLYTAGITPSTTVADLAGHLIIKINTYSVTGKPPYETGWMEDTPAMFSRYKADSTTEIYTSAMNWGSPVTPEITEATSLKWIFSGRDNGSSDNRIKGWAKYAAAARQSFAASSHDTWFGYDAVGYASSSSSMEQCKIVTKAMNNHILTDITKPVESIFPTGIISIGFSLDPDSKLKSEELIRAIINNNAALPPNR